jgi:hypothetical protein
MVETSTVPIAERYRKNPELLLRNFSLLGWINEDGTIQGCVSHRRRVANDTEAKAILAADPDMIFSPTLLYHLINAIKMIPDEYYILTPQTTPTFSFGTTLNICSGGIAPALPTSSSNSISGSWSPAIVDNAMSFYGGVVGVNKVYPPD